MKVAQLNNGRRDRLIKEREHDPYHSKRKLKEPALCTQCGVVYQAGRWQWVEAPEGAACAVCPACRRIMDRLPAAFLHLSGDFFYSHREEIDHLVDNYEAREKSAHPLKRIIERKDEAKECVISFTDAHLARGIGDALYRAYRGTLDYQYAQEDVLLRLRWFR